MSRYLQSAAVLAVLVATTPAFAADLLVVADPPVVDAPSRAYATFFAGASLPHAEVTGFQDPIPLGLAVDIDFDTGYILGAAIGTEILPSLRGEVEFSVVKSTVGDFFGSPVDVDATGYNVLGNLWYDIDTGSSFTPYIGGGIGYGYDVISSDDTDDELNTSGFLYQLGLGVRIAATDNISFDLGYRYRVQPDAEISGDGSVIPPDVDLKSSATNHIVQAGVSIGF